ncbi:ribonuclease Y [Borreliella kurtenbachii]|uniref:ribonuclease Y n=1 Tax=Borreliella TaxID=64895 RepID=UPI002658B98F|nr:MULTISPECIES: ribonuclease Y [Borreliella]WKC87252.1 ribonuclease Y [Borreliella kurtenbachii]WNY60285.1 ribonuclease Y [Borreliella bissettiae]WNY62954.1 ribonuclease Y [Borreliella carolinensis]WNY65042.1 ribonuclease Y [Borreliella carolinensis]
MIYIIFSSIFAGFILGFLVRVFLGRLSLLDLEKNLKKVRVESQLEIENERRQIIANAKSQMLKEKNQQDRDIRDRKNEIVNLEKRLLQREETLDKRISALDKQQSRVDFKIKEFEQKEKVIREKEADLVKRLENISGLTREDARKIVIEKVEHESKRDAQVIINKSEQEAQLLADKVAKDILVSTMQRIVTEVSSEFTVASVELPNDEMKGRIIGKEGRNIRALETLIGADIIIDDTPEAVVISCFDPIRKELAKRTLERLVTDGRIHPARIEEVVYNVTNEINSIIQEEGEKVVFDLNIHGLDKRLIRGLGRLYFRSSYGQNVLSHSKETAIIGEILAKEMKLDPVVVKRACLLHDIGKGMESISDNSEGHAITGAELAQSCGESEIVVNAIAAHHNEVKPESLEAIVVQIADAISASRPGARRESLNNYINRLKRLEDIAYSFEGVQKCYAIQAGREVRIIVDNAVINDEKSILLARDIAKKIEAEMRYPGKIKVTIIRETRVIEYAR